MNERYTGLYGNRRSPWWAVFVIALCLIAVVLLAACSVAPIPATRSDMIQSDKVRATPLTKSAELAELVNGNSAFAFDLYQVLGMQEGNLFYSPHSISLGLSMVYAGARGQTERQMADVLHFLLLQDKLHPAFNSLSLALDSRGESGQDDADRENASKRQGVNLFPKRERDQGFRLSIVNAVWGQQDHDFLEPFLDVLAENYGAGVRPADFRAAPEETRTEINDWVAASTENRIKDLVPSDVITPLTRMVLVNAIYFKAAWSYPFNESNTRNRPFHLLDGGSTDVPMMKTQEDFGYAAADGYQAVDLPYVGHELSMTIMLPDKGRFKEFESSLDASLVDRIIADLEEYHVELELPKFEFESKFRLSEPLRSIGMSDAFNTKASDFSGMDGRSCLAGDDECLYLREVIHQSFVSVDEAGTEAAAATAAVMATESAPPQWVKVVVDRPFIFLIRDRATEAILFVGRVEEI